MASPSSICSYYFSGTGNSAKVVEWVNQVADEQHIKNKAINIAKINRRNSQEIKNGINPEALLLMVGPTHGFNYPPILMHFIFRFPKGKNQVALMNTRAGMRIGKWITPGLSGIALFLAAIVLKIKGYRIHSLYPVDMPSNWIFLHPGLTPKAIIYLHRQNRIRVRRAASRILSGERLNRGYWDIIQDLLISPISIGYYFIGRFVLSKTLFASVDCKNCGLCMKQCGVDAITEVQGRPFWTHKCESCMQCLNNCPENAINTGHGYVIGLSILYTFVLMGLFYKGLDGVMITINSHWIEMAINNVLFVFYLFAGYRIIHYVLRFRAFSRLAEFTSLTRFKFWGRRYKAMKDKDF